jgi:hypothetical protein
MKQETEEGWLHLRISTKLKGTLSAAAGRSTPGGQTLSAFCRDILIEYCRRHGIFNASHHGLRVAEPAPRYHRKKSQRSTSSGEDLRRGGGT